MKKKTIGAIAVVALLMVAVAPSASAQAEDDVILFRSGAWFGNISEAGGFGPLPGDTSLGSYGAPWANPMVGDVNGDGFDDMVVAQDPEDDGVGAWGWAAAHTVDTNSDDVGEMSSTLGTPPTSGFAWGAVADTRYTGLADITGDGIQDAVFVTGGFLWFSTPSTTNGLGTGTTQGNIQFGATSLNDHPILGDFNGDGMDDFGVWRPGGGGTFVKLTGGTVGSGVMGTGNGGAAIVGSFGNADWDYPLVGDINGDGRDDLVLVESETTNSLLWYAAFGQADGSFSTNDQSNIAHFGATNDVPMLADINGDGMDDLVVVKGETTFEAAFTDVGGVLTTNVDSSLGWGTTGDIPLFGQLNLFTIIVPPPEIGPIAVDQVTSGLELTWITGAGHDYLLQSKASLTDISWASNATYTATGASMTVTTAVDQAKSFYRVIVE